MSTTTVAVANKSPRVVGASSERTSVYIKIIRGGGSGDRGGVGIAGTHDGGLVVGRRRESVQARVGVLSACVHVYAAYSHVYGCAYNCVCVCNYLCVCTSTFACV